MFVPEKDFLWLTEDPSESTDISDFIVPVLGGCEAGRGCVGGLDGGPGGGTSGLLMLLTVESGVSSKFWKNPSLKEKFTLTKNSR